MENHAASAAVYVGRGKARLRQAKWQLALADADEAIKTGKDQVGGYIVKGQAQRGMKVRSHPDGALVGR
eukprot:749122-Pyramimonas_sp.AAC.1